MTTKSQKGKKSKGNGSAERVVTMWWVLFNKPSACSTNPAGPVKYGVPDIMGNAGGGTNAPNIAIINASGGISDSTGFLRLAAALYKTNSCALDVEADNGQYVWGGPPPLYDGSSFGYCPAEREVTEVHIVIRDHGPVTENKIKQLTTFTDPSCSQAEAGGSNLCVDIGAVGFPPPVSRWTDDQRYRTLPEVSTWLRCCCRDALQRECWDGPAHGREWKWGDSSANWWCSPGSCWD